MVPTGLLESYARSSIQSLRDRCNFCHILKANELGSSVLHISIVFVGNNEFGMNQPGIGDNATQRRAITAQELPRLDEKKSQELHVIDTQFTDATANNTV